ncbi:MAG: HD domain-containing protein [Clostridia bacterium]|nr:HD domain-containing protein [Clostridia bacterium]
MLTFADIKHNDRVKALIEAGNQALGALGFTDHGYGHAGITAETAAHVLRALGYNDRTCELARIAAYMHDIGNAVNRVDHALTGATMAFSILSSLDADPAETAAIVTAIGNHDEHAANAVSPLSAALIIADKSDVRRSRVRCKPDDINFDIHDRVNYAVVDSDLYIDKDQQTITLKLTIDTAICPVMDYFEIFLTRMVLCRKAANHLGQHFELIINDTKML